MKNFCLLFFLLLSPVVSAQNERLHLRANPIQGEDYAAGGGNGRVTPIDGREPDERYLTFPRNGNYLKHPSTPPFDNGVYFLYYNYGYRPYNFSGIPAQ